MWPFRRRTEEDFRREIEAHLAIEADRLMGEGLSPEEARYAAARRFGNVASVQERFNESRRGLWLEQLWHDARYAARSLRRDPTFAIAAIVTLGLGMGANTAVFSLVDRVLRSPVATPDIERLVVVRLNLPALDLMDTPVSPAEIPDLAARTDLFESFAGVEPADWNLTGEGEAVRVAGARTVGSFFETFRVQPHLGRFYTAEHSTTGPQTVAVLSYGAWQQLTGGDPLIVGRTIQLDGRAHEVLGVLPAGFRYPRHVQVYTPFHAPNWQQNRGRLSMVGIGRLQPGVTHAQLDAGLWVEAARRTEQLPPGMTQELFAVPFVEYLAGRLRLVLLVLGGAVVFVLLIACANVGSLQLVRAAARTGEIALRGALGGGPTRIIRQLLGESLILALAGGALGLWLGVLTLEVLARWDPAQQHALDNVRLDRSVLIFTALVSMAAAVVFGTLPALRATRIDLQRALADRGRRTTGNLGPSGLLQASVVVQVALALVLLLGSGLMIRTLAQLLDTNPGFNAERLVTAQVALPGSRYGSVPSQAAFYEAVLERLRAVPGIEGATLVWALPFSTQIRDSSPFDIVGRPAREGEPRRHAEYRVVDGEYFRTMGIPLLRGRTFDGRDAFGSPGGQVVVIDETFASQFFPNEDPIDQEIQHARGPARIIGVVGRVQHGEIGEPEKALSYYHFHQTWSAQMALVARTSLEPAAAATLLRSTVREIDAGLPLYDVSTMEQRIQQSLGHRRLAMVALAGFSALALLLATLGVYGVVAYRTAQRTGEIGLRMALGATRRQVLQLMVRQGMRMTTLGVIIGLGAALALTRLLEGILYGVSARDPLTFALVTLVLALAALAATLVPARHALRVDPALALRSD